MMRCRLPVSYGVIIISNRAHSHTVENDGVKTYSQKHNHTASVPLLWFYLPMCNKVHRATRSFILRGSTAEQSSEVQRNGDSLGLGLQILSKNSKDLGAHFGSFSEDIWTFYSYLQLTQCPWCLRNTNECKLYKTVAGNVDHVSLCLKDPHC